MAKAKLNSALTKLSGTIDNWVYSDTAHGPVIARKGRRRRPWSQAQKEQRRRLTQDAAAFYHAEMRDPAKNAHYRARAKALNLPVSAFVMGGFMKHGPRFSERESPGAASTGGETTGRDGADGE